MTKKKKKDDKLTHDQVEHLTQKSKELPKHLRRLERILLALGGRFALIKPNEPDHGKLVTRGEVKDGKDAVMVKGKPCNCHGNAARLFIEDILTEIWTGYALSADGIWRQHSWGWKDGKVLETTESREIYCGIQLNVEESFLFVLNNVSREEATSFLVKRGTKKEDVDALYDGRRM